MIFLPQILLLVLLLFLSGFFSGSEVALFSLNPIRVKKLQKQGKDTSVISSLINEPSKLLVTVLIGNELVNVWISSLSASITLEFFGQKFLGMSIIIVTSLLLIFGEVLPKTISIYNPERISLLIARPLKYFSSLILPVRFVVRNLADRFILLLGIEEAKEPLLTEDELKTIIDVSHKKGVVKKTEHDMILSVMKFTDMQVDQIMIPRVDIKAVKKDIAKDGFIEFVKKVHHSKIPVYENTIDKITGVLYTKDVFFNSDKDISELIKPIIFVPGSKKIDELLALFNQSHTKIAVVIDEFGGTDGMVALEDVLEEIFGEIYDEFDTPEELINRISENKFKISAKAELSDINKVTGARLRSKEAFNLAVFVLEQFGKIPSVGEHVDYKGWRLTVENMAAKRIISVILEKK